MLEQTFKRILSLNYSNNINTVIKLFFIHEKSKFKNIFDK